MDSLLPMKDEKYILIKFFKGEKTELSAQQRDKLFDVFEGKKIIGHYSLSSNNKCNSGADYH